MASPSIIRSDVYINGVLSSDNFTPPANCIGDTAVQTPGSGATAVGTAKLKHRYRPVVSQAATVVSATDRRVIYVVNFTVTVVINKLTGTITLLYGLGGYQSLIANRWRCQINENAKHLAFVNAYPELCHNEIVGWEGALKQSQHFAGVVLTDGTESAKMKTRAAVTEQLTADKCQFTHVQAEGESLLERMLSLTYYGDWVSIYLARLNGADPVEIVPIDTLKEELAKVD